MSFQQDDDDEEEEEEKQQQQQHDDDNQYEIGFWSKKIPQNLRSYTKTDINISQRS